MRANEKISCWGCINIDSEIALIYSKTVNLNIFRYFLDLGGRLRTYAIHFCMNNPELRATLFDLTNTREFAEKTISSFNLSNRIQLKHKNYLDEDINIEQKYDASWLSHILH